MAKCIFVFLEGECEDISIILEELLIAMVFIGKSK